MNYYIDLDERSDKLDVYNKTASCLKYKLSTLKNNRRASMLVSKYDARQKAAMDATLSLYIGSFKYHSHSQYNYFFDFDKQTLTIETADELDGNALIDRGFKPVKSKHNTKSYKLCKELAVEDFAGIYEYAFYVNSAFIISERIEDGTLSLNEDQLIEFYIKQVDYLANYKLAMDKKLRSIKQDCSTIVVLYHNLDIYNGKYFVNVECTGEELAEMLSHGWEIDDRNRAYRSKYIRFENMLGIVFADKYNIDYKNTGMLALPLTFQVTEACNLCCTYCFQTNKSSKRMSIDTAKATIDYLLTRDDTNSTYFKPSTKPFVIIEFVGGDGLLEIDLIDEILSYFIKRAIELNHPWAYNWSSYISTNGVLYRSPRVQEVLAKWKSKLTCTITVDGSKELHDKCRIFPDGSGSYDLAMDALMDQFTDYGDPSTKITLAPDNISYFKESIIDFIEKGVKHIWFNGIYEHVWTVQEGRQIYEDLKDITEWLIEHKLEDDINIIPFSDNVYTPLTGDENKNYCGGDGHMLAVNPDGEFFNCYRYMGTSLNGEREPLRIGDINIGIGNTDKDKKNIHEMSCVTRRSQSSDECFYCPIATGCGWCSAYNYQLYGTCNKRTTSTCKLQKSLALANLYYWNRLHEIHSEIAPVESTFDYEFVSDIISIDEFNKLIQMSGGV